MEKLGQDLSVVKKSIIEPPRQLDPQFRVDEKGRPISEQEFIERRTREAEWKREGEEKAERRARWEGKSPGEILCMEMERIRPGTLKDGTFSLHPRADMSIDVHLMGRVFRVLPHVVAISSKDTSWHITAQGALDRLRTAAVRPEQPSSMKQTDIYEEQADILREVAKAAGIYEEEALQDHLASIVGLGQSAVRWKSEMQFLFIYLRKRLKEITCPTPSPQPQQLQSSKKHQSKKHQSKKPQSKKPRPKAGPRPKIEGPAVGGSQTTTP